MVTFALSYINNYDLKGCNGPSIFTVYLLVSWNSPAYLVYDALVDVLWLLCIVHVYVIQAQPAR